MSFAGHECGMHLQSFLTVVTDSASIWESLGHVKVLLRNTVIEKGGTFRCRESLDRQGVVLVGEV